MSRYPHVVRNRFPLAAAIALLAALAASILLTGPPSLVHAANEPVSLTLAASNGKITASWTAPNVGTGQVNDYRYQYKKQSESNWSTEATTTATSVEITGLDNGVTYDVRVRTRYTAAGSNTAEYSDYVKTWTTPGTAPGAVTGVTLTSGDGKIIVTWGLTSAVPPVSSYGVRYRQKDSNTWVSLSDPDDVTMVGTALTTNETSHGSGGDPLDLGEITHATLTAREILFVNESVGTGNDAKSGVYRLSDGIRSMNFRAHSIQFDNPATVTMRYAATKPTATTLHTHGRELCSIATTPPQLPDGKHTAVCSGNINDATGSIPTGGYLWAYTVDSETAVSRNWVIRNPKPAFDNGRAVITGVTNGTEYEVEVNATNPAGSSASWSNTSSTKAGGPDAPDAPTLAPGNAQLSVSWTAPANNGSAITDYDVRYKAKTANTWTSHAFTGAGTSTTISSGIANGTEYEVQVRATNGNGTGGVVAVGHAESRPAGRPRRADAHRPAPEPGGELDGPGQQRLRHHRLRRAVFLRRRNHLDGVERRHHQHGHQYDDNRADQRHLVPGAGSRRQYPRRRPLVAVRIGNAGEHRARQAGPRRPRL